MTDLKYMFTLFNLPQENISLGRVYSPFQFHFQFPLVVTTAIRTKTSELSADYFATTIQKKHAAKIKLIKVLM